MTPEPGIEPGPHWWEASTLTTVPSLLPQTIYIIVSFLANMFSLKQEMKSAVFGYLTLKEGFCVGMKVKGDTKWLKINYRKGSSAVGIFMESYGHVSIRRSQWKPLINGSYMPVSKQCCDIVHLGPQSPGYKVQSPAVNKIMNMLCST